jgi:ribosomal protein L17
LSGEEFSDELRKLVQLSAIATTGLSADEIRALSERVVQDARKHGLI